MRMLSARPMHEHADVWPFQPAAVMPTQAPLQFSPYDPISRPLALATIELALKDLTHRQHHIRADAIAWFEGDCWTFDWACDLLDLPPDRLRAYARAIIEKEKGNPSCQPYYKPRRPHRRSGLVPLVPWKKTMHRPRP